MQPTKLSRYYGKAFELTDWGEGKTAARFLPSGRTVFIACKTGPVTYQKLYVCSPLSAPSPEGIEINMRKARQYMQETAAHYGCRAIAPHAYLPQLLNDRVPEERALALSFGHSLLSTCDGVVICGNTISKGMAQEIAYAASVEMPVLIRPDLEVESWCMEL